ncbi:MAG: export transporter periplasmic protein LptC [Pseudomonadota bacterium]|jgi:lipopolysaccharide export system protein LptC
MSRAAAWLRLGWERLTGYLPLLFMALLAAATYALLQATPEPEEPRPERPVSAEPDFFMRGFSLRSFAPDGRLRTEMFGQEARHRPDTDAIQIDQARVRSIDETGAVTSASAKQLTSNSQNNVFDLTGQAVVVRRGTGPSGQATEPVRFEGEFLRIYTEPTRFFSDQAVVILRGNDRLVAQGLDYSGEQERVVFSGRVKVELMPNPEPITMP